MSEFTYMGECPGCKKYSTFWGGSSQCECDDCGHLCDPHKANLKCTGMW
jgi:hypothetical protein